VLKGRGWFGFSFAETERHRIRKGKMALITFMTRVWRRNALIGPGATGQFDFDL
jgi:hypothetical protein